MSPCTRTRPRRLTPGSTSVPEKQQLIGVKKGKVQVRKLAGQILTVGRVAYDPNLFVAQQEYLQALKGHQSTQKANLDYLSEQSQSLLRDMRRRLLLLGMSEAEIDELEKQGRPESNLYLPSSEDKTVWVYITIYEYEAGLVKEGMPVQVDTLAYPGQIFQGKIVSITPLLEMATRTLKARALVENPEGKLKLEMFANVRIDYDAGREAGGARRGRDARGHPQHRLPRRPERLFHAEDRDTRGQGPGLLRGLAGSGGG